MEEELIDFELYSVDPNVIEERNKKYLATLNKLYGSIKPLTKNDYDTIKPILESGDKSVMLILVEKTIPFIGYALAKIYAKYDIEPVLDFEEALSYALSRFYETVPEFEYLPNCYTAYASSLVSFYVYKFLKRDYFRHLARRERINLVKTKSVIWEIDKQETDDFAFNLMYSAEVREKFLKIIKCLKPRNAEILLMRFGFITGEPMTYSAIAKHFNISRNAVKIYEEAAIKKLKKNKIERALKAYDDGMIIE